jgi:hypothetical protein
MSLDSSFGPSRLLIDGPPSSIELEVRDQIWALLSLVQPRHSIIERRAQERYPFPRMIVLAPLEPDTERPLEPAFTGVGRQLSEGGIGFFHAAPLNERRVAVTLEPGSKHARSFLVDLSWCRFTKFGWYEGGGRFLKHLVDFTPPALSRRPTTEQWSRFLTSLPELRAEIPPPFESGQSPDAGTTTVDVPLPERRTPGLAPEPGSHAH